MSNGLPSYGRYISRPSLSDLQAEVADEGKFPFQFALVTFTNDDAPVVVFKQNIYEFLSSGGARRLVDAAGNTVVEAAPDEVTSPTRYLVAQNAPASDPVELRSFEEGGGPVDLLVMAQGTGLAALATNEGTVAAVADSAFGLRAIRRTAFPPAVSATAFYVDHIPASALVTGDGSALDLRILPPGDPFGGAPINLASISARVANPGGTPTSSVDFSIISGNVLTLNGAGAKVWGRATIDGLVYDSTPTTPNPAVGTNTVPASAPTPYGVANTNVEDNSIISITPRSQLVGATQWWVEVPPGGGSFELHFDAATLSADWDFDYEVKRVST